MEQYFVQRLIISLFLLFFLLSSAFAQHSSPDTLTAYSIDDEIKLDGVLNETSWNKALKISNFTQRKLNNGETASEKTETAILFNETTLYIGVWCYDSHPENIIAKNFIRDFKYGSEDNFEIIFDTYKDNRNGYLFIINPNGARYDAQCRDDGENVNSDWNGVWDVATQVTDKGWFAEIEIPFSTLQFQRDSLILWGLNMERNIRYKKEQLLWQGWSRDYSLAKVSHAGTLTGLRNIKTHNNIEIKPYLLLGAEKNFSDSFIKKLGCDIITNVTPTIKANITYNTDFAQVDADKLQVNLTRFSLYYPEKREFFLENADLFSVYLGNSNQLFYSRRIGLSNFEQVPVIAGARVVGKEDKTNFGAFSIQTEALDSLPTTNYSVVRIKQDVLDKSSIGAIFSSKASSLLTNLVYGIDGNYVTSKLFGNKNLVIGGVVSQSFDRNVKSGNYAVRAFVDYPNDLIDTYYGYSQVQENYDPQIGFLQRSNFKAFNGQFYFMPRWLESWGIQQFVFKPYEYSFYWTDNTNQLESYINEIRPLGFTTMSGESFEFNVQQFYDRIDEPFELTDSIIITPGNYYFNPVEFQFSTYSGRRVNAQFFYNFGKYYTGNKKTLDILLNAVFFDRFIASLEWSNNQLDFQDKVISINEISSTIRYSISTKLNIAVFTQWISEENYLSFNWRLHWIPKIGSDFYLVFNHGYEESFRKFNDLYRPKYAVGMFKLVWRFAI